MNGADDYSSMHGEDNQACILVGSNINPIQNCRLAILELSTTVEIIKHSSIWETESIGSEGENFLNFAIFVETKLDCESLKMYILKPLEITLGRVRGNNKNAPRTMDLDVVIFNGVITDKKVWEQYFSALPVSELFPELLHEKSGKTLKKIAYELSQGKIAICRNEMLTTIFSGRVYQ